MRPCAAAPADSSKVGLTFTATGHGRQAGIGETLQVPSDALVDVRIDVSGVPDGTMRFVTDEGQMHQESLGSSGSGTVVWRTTAAIASYVGAEVRHPVADGATGPMAALSNPITLWRTDG